MSKFDLKRGDIILHENGECNPISELIKYFTNSKYKQTKSSIYVRKVSCEENTFSKTNLEKIHQIVYDKSYDFYPTDIIEAL